MGRTFEAATGTPSRSVVETLAGLVTCSRRKVSLWRDRARYRRALAMMSERARADIGVCRSQIAEEVAKPFWRS